MLHRCERNYSEASEQIYDLQVRYTKDSLVTKREENTRSHPEHGRKDS